MLTGLPYCADGVIRASIFSKGMIEKTIFLIDKTENNEVITIAVPPQYTSVNCSSCGAKVQKTLSTRTHQCKCGCSLGRDENAARNILSLGLNTTAGRAVSAWGDKASI